MANFQVINLNSNPNIREHVQQQIQGRQMKALALKRITEIQRMKALGIAKPASVLNFNPCAIRLESGIPGKVPSVVDPSVHPSLKLEFEYKKRKYRAVIQTWTEPHFYPWITDVFKGPDDQLADGVGVYDIKCCRQIEIAYDFWQDYNGGTFNALRMGGIIAFQGDKYALKGQTIDVPVLDGEDAYDKIEIPEYIQLANDEREFITKPRLFQEVMAESLDRQKDYYDWRMLTAGTYWNDADQRKNITNMDLVWAQYGLDMGWREKPVDWHVSAEEPEGACTGCGAGRARATAYFCHKCNRAYDPFLAYMDQELPFDDSQMNRVSDEQWDDVIIEENRRRARRGRPPIGQPEGGIVQVPVAVTPTAEEIQMLIDSAVARAVSSVRNPQSPLTSQQKANITKQAKAAEARAAAADAEDRKAKEKAKEEDDADPER